MFAPLNISTRRYVDYLRCLRETLANLQALSSKTPGFVLDSVGLAMENVSMHVDTIPIVQQILLLDIPTKKFRLPSQKRKKPGDLVAWRGVWSEFVRTLCGIPDLEKAYRTASIQTIRIALDCDTSDLTLLCSALAEAKVVQHVMLYKHQVEGSDFGIYDELSVGGLADALEERVLSKEICRWLSFALLSKAATPSVEILSLNGYTLGASEASATTEVVSSTDPMDAMLHGFGQCRSKDPTQREVLRLPAGIWRNERGQVKKRRVHTWIRVLSC